MMSPSRAAFPVLCLLMLACSLPLLGQKGGSGGGAGGGGKGGGGTGSNPGAVSSVPTNGGIPGYGSWPVEMSICKDNWACPVSTPRPMPATPTNDDPNCFLSPIAGIHSPTVNVTRLEVPHKARQEYEKACSALKHQKVSDAEERLTNAVKLYPEYAAAWVLLGQIQEIEHRNADAAQSCSQAKNIDQGYAPAYLCLAYLVAADKKWDQLRQLTESLLQLHALNASNAYYYNALAYLHLNKLSAAEISAHRGIEDNKKHHQPHLHLLLAEIYEREGDRRSEIAELHEYLKLDPHGHDTEAANKLLRQIEPDTAARR